MKFPCINLFYHENMNYLQIDLEYNSRLFPTVPCLEIIFGYIFAFTFFYIYTWWLKRKINGKKNQYHKVEVFSCEVSM